MSVSALDQKYELERPAKSITGLLPLKAELALVGIGTLVGGASLWGLYYGITATGGALFGLNNWWSVIKSKQDNNRSHVQQLAYLQSQEYVHSDMLQNRQLKKRVVTLTTTVALTVLFNYLYISNCQRLDGGLCRCYSYLTVIGVLGSLISAGYTITKAVIDKK